MSVIEKKFESYLRDRLTFSNIDSRTSVGTARTAHTKKSDHVTEVVGLRTAHQDEQ